jgi:hypothetical protein
MIALASDCLLFRTASGESVPYSADMLSDELAEASLESFDPEVVHHAVGAVFHYFKHELGRETVTLGEFAGALDTVLQKFAVALAPAAEPRSQPEVAEADLVGIAREAGEGSELFFFPRLRAELRQQLLQGPRVLRFHGLRGCVKQLIGAHRWSYRCQALEGRIVAYLRECLSAEPGPVAVALVVE